MFIGRKEEIKQLENVYRSAHSNLIVLYGREGIGKTALAMHFAENRSFMYFHVPDSIENEQFKFFEKLFNRFNESAEEDASSKRIIIIDEFHLIKSSMLVEKIAELLKNEESLGKYMIIMLSSSINWIENSMVTERKDLARIITGITKLKELSFAETVEWFPKASVEDSIIIRGLLGGVPKYLSLWQENRRVRENILSLFLMPDSPLKNEPELLLKSQLRELSAYNTILTALAQGNYKLNDIYFYTGFSRAKISVYLKNLIEMDIVEKIFSMSVRHSENTMKGLYRIKDNFFSFYYAYVYPNISDIECGRGKNIYNEKIIPEFDRYMRPFFADVCREYLDLMSRYKRLGYKYSEWRSWYGKNGTLDVIGQDSERHLLVSSCSYAAEPEGSQIITDTIKLAAEAGLKNTKFCIFARSGFTDEANRRAKEEGILLVPMSDL